MTTILDTECIGTTKPIFLVCTWNIITNKRNSFWAHKQGDMHKLETLLSKLTDEYPLITFNGNNYDRPLIAAAIMGSNSELLKHISNSIISNGIRSWQTYNTFNIDFYEYPHIDLFEIAPGVMTSLKTYGGRMHVNEIIDLPFPHDKDLTEKECKMLEKYCQNDLIITAELYNKLKPEIELRRKMSIKYGLDLMSKSDAQIAEAILKKAANITTHSNFCARWINYKAPPFINTTNKTIRELIKKLEEHKFLINASAGQIIPPKFLEEEFKLGSGSYQLGIGGLHSTHEKNTYYTNEQYTLTDWDVASYYPSIMLKAGIKPNLPRGAGDRFIQAYNEIYHQRIEAKHKKDKTTADSLKLALNGTFGKLGNMYCSFYSPDLLLAVTLTGQLHLLCLIDKIEATGKAKVISANTDGILVSCLEKHQKIIARVFQQDSKISGFEYESTPYSKIGFKDVNNYLALKLDGTFKTKGLYATSGLMKNPTMEVCVKLVKDYLATSIKPELAINKYTDIRDFIAIRNVKGGGIQHLKHEIVNDWIEIKPGEWKRKVWPENKTTVKRKTPPPSVQVGVGGKPFGRIARWYMTTKQMPPITYLSGSQVPKTEGAKICMKLPDKLPLDLNLKWYCNEAYSILNDMGVKL